MRKITLPLTRMVIYIPKLPTCGLKTIPNWQDDRSPFICSKEGMKFVATFWGQPVHQRSFSSFTETPLETEVWKYWNYSLWKYVFHSFFSGLKNNFSWSYNGVCRHWKERSNQLFKKWQTARIVFVHNINYSDKNPPPDYSKIYTHLHMMWWVYASHKTTLRIYNINLYQIFPGSALM